MSTENPRKTEPDRERAAAARVWLLLGHKPGDNAQIRNLARAVGLAYEEKKIVVKPQWELGKPRIRASLAHIDRARSDTLDAPWPDLVISAGRRLACVELWIQQASQGRSRLVMIGMPRHRREQFDLLVVASHYVIEDGPNVVRHDLPLMHVDPALVERAASAWEPRFRDLPRPITALMIGGPTGGLRFDLEAARSLVSQARAEVARSGGSLFVTTSRRTPAAVVAWLERECPDGVRLHVFDAKAPPEENPYHALLGLAEHFIVTSDSLSMMVEVVRLAKSVAIFALANDTGPFELGLERIGLLTPLDPRRDPIPAGGVVARTSYRLGLPIHSRDLSAVPRRLVERGLASWLGEARVEPAEGADDEALRIAARVRGLVAGEPGSL